jgi:hypothetical protein
MTILRELSKYKLELVRIQKSDGRVMAQNQQKNTFFSVGKKIRTMNRVEVFFLHKRIMSAVKRVLFVSDMSYIILRGAGFISLL